MINYKIHKIFFLIILTLLNLSFFEKSFAVATTPKVYFEIPPPIDKQNELGQGSQFSVQVYADSDQEINAADVELSYTKSKIQFLGSDESNSIINIWSGKPDVVAGGNIAFSGGIIKPFKGAHALLATLIFKGAISGTAEIKFVKSKFYAADGKGTEISPSHENISFLVKDILTGNPSEEGRQVFFNIGENKDDTPPELTAEIVKNPLDNSSLISFIASDEESGIKTTEMRVKTLFTFSSWQVVTNPALFPAAAWSAEIRAVNGAGLETIREISLKSILYQKLAILLIISISVLFIVWYNKRQSI
jgi:hypothetical protein